MTVTAPRRAIGLAMAAALLVTACSSGSSPSPSSAASTAVSPSAAASTAGSPSAAAGSPAASGAVDPPADIGKSDQAQVTGAGSTAIQPFLTTIAAAYKKDVAPGVTLNYQGIGSGGGITQFTAKTVDFGASDVYMSDQQEQATGQAVVNIPMIHWAVAITYNVPNVSAQLDFSPATIAGIYLGTIKKWNDPAIAADNPGVTLPDLGIAVAHRSDGSGTTYNFTAFLSGVSSDWKSSVGTGTSVKWPTGAGGKGSAGVTQLVKGTPGAIGYVELSYALQNSLPVGAVKNAAGDFVKPTLESTTDAVAAAVPTAPADLRFLVVNPPADHPNAYPIAASTWVLLYKDYPSGNASEIKSMVHFLWWGIHDGQAMAAAIDYSAMAPDLVTRAEAALKSITVGGQPVLP